MADTDVSTQRDPADLNWDVFYRAWLNGHDQYVQDAERFNNYYLGDQWDESEKNELESEGRPALTLNEIMSVINAVIGHYGEQRADVQYKPRKGEANRETADVLTRLVDHIFEQNDYHNDVEPQMFQDGLIEDRGYVDVRCDFTENTLGEVKIKARNPRHVMPDPDAEERDPRKWKRVITWQWMTLDDIEAHYGKNKRDKVAATATAPRDTFGHLSVRYQGYGDDETETYPDHITQDEVKAVRVIEHQYRKMTQTQEFVDLQTGMTRVVPDHLTQQEIDQRAAEHGFVVRNRVRSRVRWTVSADHVVLHDDWSPYSDFTVVPYFPMYRRGRPSGAVRHLVDPQEQLNKIESQSLHTINNTANSGWVVESGSLQNMTEHELEQRGAENGLVLVYKRNHQPPEKIQPNQAPHGLETFAQKAGQYIQSIPGAAALLGQEPNANVSGVALDRAQSRALLGLQVFFNNLDFTRKLVAERVLDCVQNYYTEHRVFFITDWRNPELPDEQVEINAPQRPEQGQPSAPPGSANLPFGGQSMDLVGEQGPEADLEQTPDALRAVQGAQERINQGQQNETLEAAGNVVNDITVGTYDVVAGSTPTRDTFEEQQFAQILELRQAGVQIPDHHVILNSQIAGKEEIAKTVKQLQGLGEPTEAQQRAQQLEMAKAQAEVQKMRAEVAELQSRAKHNQARAQTEVAEEQRERADLVAQRQMELARLQAELEKQEKDLQNKIDVAQIHAGTKESLTRFEKQLESIENERERDNRLKQEQLRGQTQLQETGLQARADLEQQEMSERSELFREGIERAQEQQEELQDHIDQQRGGQQQQQRRQRDLSSVAAPRRR